MRWLRLLPLAALPLHARADNPNGQACQPFSANSTLIGGGPAPLNVLNNSCARINAQSVFKNESIWVTGGAQSFTNWVNDDPVLDAGSYNMTLGQNHYLIQTDMHSSWDWKCNISQVARDVGINTRTHAQVPVVKSGVMYKGAQNDSKIWLFGGTTPRENMSFVNYQPPSVDQYALWSYDMSADAWQQADVHIAAPARPSMGYTTEAPDKSLAFWLGGAIDGGSSQSLQSLGNNTAYLSGMLIFDFSDPAGPVANNVSGPPWGDPRAGGLLKYVPNFGTEGVLVALGGTSKPAASINRGEGTYVNMTEIWIMDLAKYDRRTGKLASDAWYQQTASGAIPQPRVDSCVVGIPAKDGSSYQIYTYGGRQGSTAWDNTYALSLPQFVWTLVYSGQSPRFGHTCHLYKDWQMITVGGSASPDNYTVCDWESRGVAVYDFSSGTSLNAWGSVFKTSDNPPPYRVPQRVYQDIGGGFEGGATQNAPVNGFKDTALQAVFRAGSNGSSGSSPSLGGGAIAGIVVGVVVAVALLAAGALLLFRWRRRRQAQDKQAADPGSTAASERGLKTGSPESPGTEGSVVAAAETQEKRVHEIGAANPRFEAPDQPVQELPGDVRYEVDGYTTELIELPGESKVDGARKTSRPS